QQMRRERVTQGVGAHHLGDPSGPGCRPNGALDDSFMQVMAADLVRLAIDVGAGSGEKPLPGPGPLSRSGYILARDGVRERDEAGSAANVVIVLGAAAREVLAQRVDQHFG